MEENICLLLGAGASAEQKLPEWKDLVKDVVQYFRIDLDVDKNNLIESIAIIEDNKFSELKKMFDKKHINISLDDCQKCSRRLIATATRACLKQNLINRSFNSIKKEMVLMREIALSVYNRTKSGLLTTIITYNFDDYFEFCFKCILQEKGELDLYSNSLTVHTIGDKKHHLPSGTKEGTLINVYHVHGCIPVFDEMFGHQLIGENQTLYKKRNRKTYEKYLDCGIIFSGNDYNTLIDDSIVGWTNMIQYVAFSQLPLTIIGFSLVDANFRTLIKRMKKSKQKIPKVMLFIGYSNKVPGDKAIAVTSGNTAEYLLSSVCDSGKIKRKVCSFGKAYSSAVKKHLDSLI